MTGLSASKPAWEGQGRFLLCSPPGRRPSAFNRVHHHLPSQTPLVRPPPAPPASHRASPQGGLSLSPDELDCKLLENMVPITFLLLTPSIASLRGRQCPLTGQTEDSPVFVGLPSITPSGSQSDGLGEERAVCLTQEPPELPTSAPCARRPRNPTWTAQFRGCTATPSKVTWGLLGNSYDQQLRKKTLSLFTDGATDALGPVSSRWL